MMVSLVGPLIMIAAGVTVTLLSHRIARMLHRLYGDMFGDRNSQPQRALNVSNVAFVGVSTAVVGLAFLVIGVQRISG